MTTSQIPKRSIVITGGNGFVGTYLQAELRREWEGVQIEVWDLPGVDITKPETYRDRLKELQSEWIVHLAAVSSVVVANRDPQLAYRVNVDATRELLSAMVELSPRTRGLMVSTADIYGATALAASGSPLPELSLAEAQPQNPYAQSKWQMEQMIEESFLDRTVRVRPFPHIGPGQGLGFVTADFASQIAAIEAAFTAHSTDTGAAVIKVGNLEPRRDFTDVRDVVRAYRFLMERGAMGDVYHVASGKAVAIQDILDRLLEMSSVPITVERDPVRLRARDASVLVGDAGKLRQLTGWQPEISLEQSLREILDWWRSHSSR